jgi:hypothetical protein
MPHARPVRPSSVLLLVALLGSLGPCCAADPQELAVDYHSVQLTGKFRDGRDTFRLHVACEAAAATTPSKSKLLGVGTDRPNCVVRVLTFSVNQQDVSLPPKSFADLANVSIGAGVYVTTRGDLVVLHLQGGDGEDAYKARYVIKGRQLISREVEEMDAEGEPSVTTQTYDGSKRSTDR